MGKKRFGHDDRRKEVKTFKIKPKTFVDKHGITRHYIEGATRDSKGNIIDRDGT